jgi:hypothetical protein
MLQPVPKGHPFAVFTDTMKRLVQVPKKELDAAVKKDRSQRRRRRAKRKD